MADLVLNYIGRDGFDVLNAPQSLTMPVNDRGVTLRPRHAQFSVVGDPVRWSAQPNVLTNGNVGIFWQQGTYDWLDPLTDYSAILQNMDFVLDANSVAASVEVSFYN